MGPKNAFAIGLVLWSWMGACGAPVSSGPESNFPSASTLEREIHLRGARTVVTKLWQDQSRWSLLLDRISSGRKEWLQVAVELRGSSNAGASETLQIAVSGSIQQQPENFLDIAWAAYGVKACQDLQIEPSEREHQTFMEKTRGALLRVQRPDLVNRRNACLEALSQ